ncbi:MAG TPA: glycosyltransferase [Geminicoccaceae bacterium]|nr:glycosyltransferase [Geminicoccaceae bacterium]
MPPQTVLCMRWGDRYGPEYVNRLFAMVARHLTLPHRFVCLTDDPKGIRPEVECRPLPAIELADARPHSGWRKLSCLGPELEDLQGQVLFLDLDLVVVANIDGLFAHPGAFCIIENWTRPGRGIGNSSVFRFRAGAHRSVLQRFCADAARIIRDWPDEQTYLSRSVGEVTFWPHGWCRSFKHDCLPARPLRPFREARIPADAKVIVFHGEPKPPGAARGLWPKSITGLRPVRWIDEYWR